MMRNLRRFQCLLNKKKNKQTTETLGKVKQLLKGCAGAAGLTAAAAATRAEQLALTFHGRHAKPCENSPAVECGDILVFFVLKVMSGKAQ